MLQLLALVASRWIVARSTADDASLAGIERLGKRIVDARQHNPGSEMLDGVMTDVTVQAPATRAEAGQHLRDLLEGLAVLLDPSIRTSNRLTRW